MLDRRFFISAAAGGLLLPSTVLAAVQKVVPGAKGAVNIRDFGAKGDGKTIDSAAIDKAIDAASARGGGVVYFPAGTYASYTIHLKSQVTLYLDRGAVLLAAAVPLEGTTKGGYDMAEPQDPAINEFQDYGHNHWKNSLIYGEGLHDVAILGDGLIWGKGLTRDHREDKDLPRANLPGVGCKAIALKNCRNVQLRDFSILQGGWFALLATGVDNLTIDNVVVDTNRDGFDIDCCKNVRVSNCTMNSPYDDGICPKSSFALGYARSTENVTISDCFLSGSYVVGTVIDGTYQRIPEASTYETGWGKNVGFGRIKCGTESNGGFKNITITNCVFDMSRGIALETVDGAILEDIAISNITMRQATNSPLFLRIGTRMRGPQGVPVGSIKRVLIDNITSSAAVQLPSIICGVTDRPVEDVKISNIYFQQVGGAPAAMAVLNPTPKDNDYPEPNRFGDLPATGFYIRNTKNLEMSHVEITTVNPDPRPAFFMQNVDGFDGSFLKLPAGAAGFKLDNVSGFRTFGSRSVPDKRFDTATTTQF
ncbi:MAG TPA: glycoside hydrolase family 28 protein [Asticcacaulis sp.]|nr:glycoside hydrolase family 28 protein [Asticcacaulis sp.]